MRLPMHAMKHRAPCCRLDLLPLALLVCVLGQGAGVRAQEVAGEEPLRLKSTPLLQENLPPAQRSSGPSFLFGETLSGRPELDMVLQG